ncbi:MAG: hypothetical protein ACREL7_06275, partial [Longimicrobiales bacterium]
VLAGFMVFAVAGCAQSVRILEPANGTQHSTPVTFRVYVRGYNYSASLGGQDITSFFTFNGDTAVASSAAPGFPALQPGGSYGFHAYAQLQSQPFQSVDRDDDVTFTITPLPSLAANPVSVSVDIGAQETVVIGIPGGAPAGFSLAVAPSNANVSVLGQVPGGSATVTVPAGATSQMFTVGGAQAGAAQVAVSGSGFQPVTVNATVPAPAIALTVNPGSVALPWGQTANFTADVSSLHAFNGAVTVTVDQLPAGIAAPAPATVMLTIGGSASTTFGLAVPNAGAPPGTSTFRVRATSAAQPVTRNPMLVVNRVAGAFAQATVRSGDNSCGTAVQARDSVFAVNDIRVILTADRGGGPRSTQWIPAAFYAFAPSPSCLIGVVMHPDQGGAGDPALSWYNLGFPTTTGADSMPDRLGNQTMIDWHQFWFSPDQSLLLIISKRTQAVTCVPNCPHLDMRAFLYDALTGSRLGQADFRTRVRPGSNPGDPIADVTGASLAGSTITVDYIAETGNAGSRTISF